jgi:transcriptional activator SPT8
VSGESGSEEDVDETMEDVDMEDENAEGDVDNEGDADQDGDGEEGEGDGENEGENENEDEEGENDEDDEQDEVESPSQRSRNIVNGVSQPSISDESQNPTVMLTSPSPRPSVNVHPANIPLRPSVRPEALTATYYDIVPTIAAPHSTSINAITATQDMRWVFSGGSDGYIRKFNWPDTVNGKLMLTVAQRHPFVDSVVKAGQLLSYWENEDSRM